eukprot:6487950-Amphidinium_carterae.1
MFLAVASCTHCCKADAGIPSPHYPCLKLVPCCAVLPTLLPSKCLRLPDLPYFQQYCLYVAHY